MSNSLGSKLFRSNPSFVTTPNKHKSNMATILCQSFGYPKGLSCECAQLPKPHGRLGCVFSDGTACKTRNSTISLSTTLGHKDESTGLLKITIHHGYAVLVQWGIVMSSPWGACNYWEMECFSLRSKYHEGAIICHVWGSIGLEHIWWTTSPSDM